MTADAQQLLADALVLPEDERLSLGEALLDSVHPPASGSSPDQRREAILRRAAEFRSGTITPVSWEEVQRRARDDAGA